MDRRDLDTDFPFVDSSDYVNEDDDYELQPDDDGNEELVPDEAQPSQPPQEHVVWHYLTTEAEKTDTHLRPKSDDPTWKYSLLLERNQPNGVKCLLCRWNSTGGIGRMKGHFLANDKNCKSCPAVTSYIRNEIRAHIESKKMKARKGKAKVVEPEVVFVKEQSSDPKKLKRPAVTVNRSLGSSSGSINTKVKSLSLNKSENLRDIIKNRKTQPLIVDQLKKDERLLVDRLVAKAFYSSGIPFNVRNNTDFQVFVIFKFYF